MDKMEFSAVMIHESSMTIFLRFAEWFIVLVFLILFIVNIGILIRRQINKPTEIFLCRTRLISWLLLLIMTALWIFEFTRTTQYQLLDIATLFRNQASKAIEAGMYHTATIPMIVSGYLLFGVILQSIVEFIFQYRLRHNRNMKPNNTDSPNGGTP